MYLIHCFGAIIGILLKLYSIPGSRMAESTNRQLILLKRSIFDKCAKKVNGEQVLLISKGKFNVLKRILSNFVNFQ